MDELDKGRALAGNFEVTLNLSDKRGLRMTGYIYSDDTQHEIDARVNSFQDVLDRQAIRTDLVNKAAQIEQGEATLQALAEHYEEISVKSKGGAKLTSVDKEKVAKHDQSVRHIRNQIDSLRAAIAEGRKKLNGSAA